MIKPSRKLTDALRTHAPKPQAPTPKPQATGFTDSSSFVATARRNTVALNAPTFAPTTPVAEEASPTPVEAAADRVADALAEGGTGAAAKALEDEARALGSPELVDALIEEAQEEIDVITRDLARRARENIDDSGSGTERQTEQGVRSLSAVADLATEGGVDALAGSLASAVKAGGGDLDLNQLDDRFGDLAGNGEGIRLSARLAHQLINTHGLLDAGNQILDKTTEGLGKAREAYDELQAAYAEEQQRLHADLAIFGAGMTEEERAAYQEAFWADPERQELRTNMDRAADALAETMAQVSPELEALARQGDSESAKKLLEAYESLALSDEHAEMALDFAARLVGDEALSAKIDAHTDGSLSERLSDGIIAAALPRVQGDLMAAYADQGPEGVAQAIAEFKEKIEPFKDAAGAFKDLAEEFKNLDEIIGTFGQLTTASANDLRRAQELMAEWNDSSKLGKALGVAALGFGIYSGVQNFGEGDWPQGVLDVLGAYRGGMHTAAGLVGLFTGSADTALDVAKFGGKFLPYVGLALDGAQLLEDIDNLKKDGADAGEIISIVGTGVAIIGDVAEFVPGVGTVIGGAIGVLGAAIHGLGSLVSGFINGNADRQKLHDEREALLEAAGVSEENRELLLMDPFSGISAGTLGLSREQFLEHRRLLRDAGQDNRMEGVLCGSDVAAMLGLEGEEAMGLIRYIAEQDHAFWNRLSNGILFGYQVDGSANVDQLIGYKLEQLRFGLEQVMPQEDRERLGIDLENLDPDDVNRLYFTSNPQVQ